MSAQRKSNPDTAGEDLGSPDEIMQTILSVQQQQTQVLERLHNEQLSTEQELSKGITTPNYVKMKTMRYIICR